jgi:hypothetical protein
MKITNLETISASLKSLKEIQGKLQDAMIDEENEYEKLSESDRQGEPGDQLGFEIDALDNIDYLIDEVITFIEENLGDRLPD